MFLTTIANQVHAALSAKTANVIQGTAPYIELNNIRATDLNSLLSIKIDGKTYYSNSGGYMYESTTSQGAAFTTPIELPTANIALNVGVATLIPADGSDVDLSTLSTLTPKDDDGDGNFTVQGYLNAIWTDASNTVVPPSTVATGCNSPYTLTLTVSGNAAIKTQYGIPNQTDYPDSTALFKVNPTLTEPYACWASPNGTDTNMLRIKLEGPDISINGGTFTASTFHLYASNSNEIYNFELSKWFMMNAGYYSYDGTRNSTSAPQRCNSFTGNYRVPSVSEYTNANSTDWIWGLSGWGNNTYARAIGNGSQHLSPSIIDDREDGLFAEWGLVSSRGGYPVDGGTHWADESQGANHLGVDSLHGIIHDRYTPNATLRVACVSP